MFLTAQLVITIFMLAAEKHAATFIAPVGIGLSLFIAELMGVYYTGGSLNPARSFGPCVVLRKFAGYHWIYWREFLNLTYCNPTNCVSVGPILGALLASAFYMFIKALEYESVNLTPDPREVVGKRFDPDTGKEIFITRAGGEVDIANDDIDAKALAEQGIAAAQLDHNSFSGETAVRKPETYHNGPDMESGLPNSPHPVPLPRTG
jgi:predicted outer membrane lipoprotein